MRNQFPYSVTSQMPRKVMFKDAVNIGVKSYCVFNYVKTRDFI
jgi:hypothetical protein